MPEPLKNVYTEEFIDRLLSCWGNSIPKLDTTVFKNHTFSQGWENLELKERMTRLSEAMKLILPNDFEASANLAQQLTTDLAERGFPISGFEYMFIPEFIEKNGSNHVDTSLAALKHITQYVSCEFAIRPFILKEEAKCMQFMLDCSLDQHPNVRRFSSEGCRSRLPWAMALPRFKADASLILPILENLKNDNSLFVRKSVANNLNDISKDHPELAIKIAYQWYGDHDHTNWIVKHGMRTLLKAGHPKTMQLFEYADVKTLAVDDYQLLTAKINFGEKVAFKFSVKNLVEKVQKVRLEYAVYFMKANGTQSKKVFKISERDLASKEEIHFTKQHPIKHISTRKYYSGEHGIALIVNGVEFEKQPFLLNM